MSGCNPDNKGGIQYSLQEIKTIDRGGGRGVYTGRGNIHSILYNKFSNVLFFNNLIIKVKIYFLRNSYSFVK